MTIYRGGNRGASCEGRSQAHVVVCLVQKGYTDIEISGESSKRAWLETKALAHSLGETQWESRAEGELGTIAFLEGDSKKAATMVGDAVLSAIASGDVGEQVRALEMLGNGFNEVHRYGEALAFFNRAIKIDGQNPYCGFPYMAYEGKGVTLAGEGHIEEADRALDYALNVARQNQKYGHRASQEPIRHSPRKNHRRWKGLFPETLKRLASSVY